MNSLSYFDHPLKKQNIEYFVHLVQITKADDSISNSELELLHRIGRKLGITDPEIEALILRTAKSDYIPPYELSRRFEQVYEIIKMTLVDGAIDKNEMRLATGFALRSGFIENEIPGLLSLLISGIKEGKDEDELFKEYKKEIKF
jgi:DnaJ-domain-containing protein 1